MATSPVPGFATVSESSDEMAKKVKEILLSNNITDTVSKVILKDSGLRGENMGSETELISVQFENPNKKELNLFMKKQTNNPSHIVMVNEGKLFAKESLFFMKYIPAASAFCKSKGQEKLLEIYPKCYYADDKMIIFENLKLDKGFELLPKEEMQDMHAARLALTTLAKHHGISYAFMKEVGGSEVFFKRFPDLSFEGFHTNPIQAMMEPSIENGIMTNIKILEKSNCEGAAETISMLKDQKGKTWTMLLEILEGDEEDERFRVLNHGDYWNNNMMFLKDSETNKLIGHVALDFQTSRYASPCIDISSYLYVSVKPLVRKLHMEDMLRIYFDALNDTTSDLGFPIELTFEQLFADYRKKFSFGFWFSVLLSSGVGMAVVKDIDTSKIDIKEFPTIFDRLMQKWIENNPDKCEEIAGIIVDDFKQYKVLTGC